MPVSGRLVLLFPGFEPLSAEAHARRFLRGLDQAARIYDLPYTASPLALSDLGGLLQACSFEVHAGERELTTTKVVVYGLGVINDAYEASGTLRRTTRGVTSLLEFLTTGTVWRYIRHGWRYSLFYFFPVLLLAASVGLSLAAFLFLDTPTPTAALATLAILCALLWAANRRLHLLLLLDDWSFARDLARGANDQVCKLMATIARDANERIATCKADETIFAGHSLGTVPAVMALSSALDAKPREGALGLMTVGSSLLKIALHPAAHWLRDCVGRILASNCNWLDVQSVADPLSFYKSNPATALKLSSPDRVRILHVRFREQLTAGNYRKMFLNYFKLHRQFVGPVERRTAYSFHIILCGPHPFATIVNAKKPGLPRKALNETGVAA